MSNLIEKNTKIYDNFYANDEIDGWDEQDKRFNFYYLFKIFDRTNLTKYKPTILDVGCGTGDMVRYLPIYKKQILEA